MNTYRVPVLSDFSWQPPVLDRDLTAPPVSPSKGDRYIVGVSADSGDWFGLDNHIVTYDGAAWIDDTPLEGWYCYIEDESLLCHYTGTVWDSDDISGLEAGIVSLDTRVSNTESSVGSIDTKLTNTDSSVGSIDTKLTNTDSSVGSINTVLDNKQDIGTYVSEYGAIEFTI